MIHSTYRSPGPAARSLWRLFFLLGAAQSLPALGLLAASPAGSGLPLGLSAFQLGVAAGLLALGGALAYLAAASYRAGWFDRAWAGLVSWLARPAVWGGLLLAAAGAWFFGISFLALLPGFVNEIAQAVAARLLPLVVMITGLGAQTLIGLLILRHGRDFLSLRPRGRLFYLMLLGFGAMFAGWVWAARAVLPTESERIGWNELGPPLLGLQVFAAWLCSAALMMWTLRTARRSPSAAANRRRGSADLWLSLLIWLAAVIAWQSVPIASNWFLSEPVYPNFEPYPSSDARAYDTSAQTALIGEGFRFYNSPFVRRSLLAAYMTGLHLLGGQDYDRVIFFQILALALIPVLIYHLARRIHNRYSGLLAAGLVILRETNAVRLSADITTSNVKLLMADMPATLVGLAFMLLVVIWLKNIHNRLLVLACGGMLGLAMLVRLEMALFLLPAALIAALVLWPQRRSGLWLQSGLLAMLGIGLILSPWVYRNYRKTGMWFIDNPYFSAGLFLQRYYPGKEQIEIEDPDGAGVIPSSSPTAAPVAIKIRPAAPALMPTLSPANAGPAAPAPTPTPNPTSTGPPAFMQEKDRTAAFVRQNIAALAGVVLGHGLNSQLQTLLILPNGAQGLEGWLAFIGHRSPERLWTECCTARVAVRALPYWRSWSGSIPLRAAPGLLLNLVLIAYGIQQAWTRQRWAGIAPFGMGLAYVAVNALFRNSGGRYLLPVDWVSLLYFSIGLAQLTQSGYCYLTGKTLPERLPDEIDPDAAAEAQPGPVSTAWTRSRAALPATLLALFLLGCMTPLLEAGLPKRFTQPKLEQMTAAMFNSEQITPETREALLQFLENGAGLLYGRGMYPRYFPPNVGDDVARRNAFAPRPYPRIGFVLAGPVSQTMSLPLDKRPASFPNASDLLLLVCGERDIVALAIYTSAGELDKVYLRTPFPTQNACPLPEASTQNK